MLLLQLLLLHEHGLLGADLEGTSGQGGLEHVCECRGNYVGVRMRVRLRLMRV